MRRISVLFVIVLVLGTILPNAALAEATPTPFDLRITEIKLGESKPISEEPVREFVEIYNSGVSEKTLENIRVEHVKPGYSAAACDALWTGTYAKSYTSQASSIPAGQSILLEIPLADTAGGSLRLVELNESGELEATHDLVGWGADAPCFEGLPAETPAKGKSLHRLLACDATTLARNGSNAADFAITNAPNPQLLGSETVSGCAPAEPEPNPTPTEPGPIHSCVGVVISEILPNPAGADGGHEFIELYNTTGATIALGGCKLQLLGDSGVFLFPEQETIVAGEFKAFYDTASTLTLPNSAGGTVFLLDTDNAELHSVTYPGALEDDIAWAWFGNENWESTYLPSPNADNVRQATEPCPAGEERNIETGRCRSVTSESEGLAPCAEGQVRNPETNRCRSAATAASALQACKAGQERNPETNRCRAIATTADMKPCPVGQERNPETNRCRKSTNGQVAGITDVQDVPSPAALQSWHWWVAGIAATGAVGYGAYEWRHSIRRYFDKLRGKVE